jgi:hypothetical protein
VARDDRRKLGRGHVTRTLLGAIVVVLIGCSGPSPATPRPAPIDAGVDAAPGDPAMAEVLVWLEHQRDAMCACTDAACADETDALGFDWSFAHKALLDSTHPTPAQDAAAHAAIEATEVCNERWHHAPP